MNGGIAVAQKTSTRTAKSSWWTHTIRMIYRKSKTSLSTCSNARRRMRRRKWREDPFVNSRRGLPWRRSCRSFWRVSASLLSRKLRLKSGAYKSMRQGRKRERSQTRADPLALISAVSQCLGIYTSKTRLSSHWWGNVWERRDSSRWK